MSEKMADEGQMKFAHGIDLFEGGFYREAFQVLATLYNEKILQPEIMNILTEAYYSPNKEEMENRYHKNIIQLSGYPYCWDKTFYEFDELALQLFPLNDDEFYVFNRVDQAFMTIYDAKTENNMRYFFRDVQKPLFVENETNQYNLRFLFDNVRKSEDYGGDNHIYLYYDSFARFSELLQAVDLEPLLENEKFVFLIGEENKKSYLIDFKQCFGIDYDQMRPQPLRVEEIKRLHVGWAVASNAGNSFLDEVMDYHPNLLTIPDFGLSGFGILYAEVLKNTTFDAFAKLLLSGKMAPRLASEVMLLFQGSREKDGYKPRLDNFMFNLEKLIGTLDCPTESQWFNGFFLAYAMSLGRSLNLRISPGIFFSPHTVMFNYIACLDALQELFESDQYYFTGLSIMRDFPKMIGSYIKFEDKNKMNSNYLMVLNYFLRLEDLMMLPSHPLYRKRRVVRFEDLKLNPEATLDSIGRFLNLPQATSLYRTTQNGQLSRPLLAGETSVGYETDAVFKDYAQYLSVFDIYRIELIKYPYYAYLGYQKKYYQNEPYSSADIIKMFEIPFKFEQFICPQAKKQSVQLRKDLVAVVRKLLAKQNRASDAMPIMLLEPNPRLLKVSGDETGA